MKQLSLFQKKPIYKKLPSEAEQLLTKKRIQSSCINKTLIKKRNPKSLGYMTKEVMRYIMLSKQDYIDLKDMENSIKVPKRRIYDVINVLEGKNIIIGNHFIFIITF